MYCIDVCTHVEFMWRLTLGERKWGTSRRRSSEERKRGKWGRFPEKCPGHVLGVWRFFGVLFFSSLHVCEVDMGPNMAPSRRVPRVPRVLFALRCVEIKKTLKRMKVFKTSHVRAMRPKFGNHCSAIDFFQVQFEEAVSAVICWRQQNSSDLSEKRSSCASDRSESFRLRCQVVSFNYAHFVLFIVYDHALSCIIMHYHALSWFMVIMVLIMRDLRS